MSEIADIYTHRYFRKRFGYRGAYHRFAEAILKTFRPASLIDVGCGSGWIVEYCLPRVPVVGIEGSVEAVRLMKPHVRRVVHLADLTRPPIPQVYDYEFCLCVEVAEHIALDDVPAFIEWITAGSHTLLTAAPPGQGGCHHVNEQPPKYWIDMMESRGFSFNEPATGAWRELASRLTPQAPWVVRNSMYFERRCEWTPKRRKFVIGPGTGKDGIGE